MNVGVWTALVWCVSVGVAPARLAQASSEANELQWKRLDEQVRFLREHDHAREARDLAKQLVETSQRAFGRNDLHTAFAFQLLGELYAGAGKLPQALYAYQRALTIFEQAGNAREKLADVLIVIAQLYGQQGQPDQREPLYQRALAIREALWGSAHPKVAEVLILLAKIYASDGRHEQAKVCYAKAVKALQQSTTETPEIVPVLVLVAEFGNAQGDVDDSMALYRRALQIQERALGPDHPDVANTLVHLAQMSASRGRVEEAELLWQRAATISRKPVTHRTDAPSSLASTNPDHTASDSARPSELNAGRRNALENYANSLLERFCVYVALGERGEADRLFKEALAIYQQLHAADPAAITGLLQRQAETLRQEGRLKEAQALEQRADQLQSIPAVPAAGSSESPPAAAP